jgi:hypothetical protein
MIASDFVIANTDDSDVAGKPGGGKPDGDVGPNPAKGKKKTIPDDEWAKLTPQERAFVEDYYKQFPHTNIPDQEILDAYRRGDVVNPHGGFRNPNEPPKPPSETQKPFKDRKPPDGGDWTPETILDELKGKGAGGRDKSFGPFADMLKNRKPPVTDDELRKAISELGDVKNLSEDAIRHELKTKYKREIFDELEKARKAPDFDPGKSYQDFREMVKGLNPSDKGNMMEDWYKAVHAADNLPHVRVTPDQVPGIKGDRVIDLLEVKKIDDELSEGVIRELKSHDGKIAGVGKDLSDADKKFWSQFEDYLEMSQKELKTTAGAVKIKELRYVFTSPEGFAASSDALQRMLKEAKDKNVRLVIEHVDEKGVIHTIDNGIAR